MQILAIDVGMGTQDILLYDDEKRIENCYKMVLPSPTLRLAERVRSANGKEIFLTGRVMGGGHLTRAVKEHLRKGGHVYATPDVALTLNDLNLEELGSVFEVYGMRIPERVAVAVQDHGFAPHMSNRIKRFEIFKEVLKKGGRLDDFAYKSPPPEFNRMQAEGRIISLFEHHTSKINAAKVDDYTKRLADGNLDFEEIFDDGGHGCYIHESIGFDKIKTILLTGPNREIMKESTLPVIYAVPFGDAMLTGCFGLVENVV